MHPKYKAVYDAVVVEGNRPDRVNEIHLAITNAARELHGLREWKRDSRTTRVKLLRPSMVVSVPMSNLPNFASLGRVRSSCGLEPTSKYEGDKIEFTFPARVYSLAVEFTELPEITPTSPSWVFDSIGYRLLLATALRNFHTAMNNERAASAKRAEIGAVGDSQSLIFGFLRRATDG